MFSKFPLYLTLLIDLEAVYLLFNLPLVSNLKPVICLYLRFLIILL